MIQFEIENAKVYSRCGIDTTKKKDYVGATILSEGMLAVL
jgi:hypothetical protein